MSRTTTTGVWYFTDRMAATDAVDFAQRIEELGYSTLWLPETIGRDPFTHIAFLAAHTDRLRFGTGIANIHHRHPGAMKQAAHALADQSAGRFVLGLGVSHAPFVEGFRKVEYTRPLATMRAYLEAMEASPYGALAPSSPPPTVLAALGPKMLALAAEKCDGAHPYLTTPEHTASARQVLGEGKLLVVEQKVLLSTDPSRAREVGRQALALYVDLPNYRNNWKRLGFSDDEIDQSADRLVDGLIAWGGPDEVAGRVRAHDDAGADQVCIQPLHPGGSFGEPHWPVLEALAPGRAGDEP